MVNHSTAAEHITPKLKVSLCEDRNEWIKWISNHTSCSYFQWYFRDVIEQVFGHTPHFFVARDNDGTILAALPLIEMKSSLFGHFAVSLPFVNYGGLVTHSEHYEAVNQLIKYVENWGVQNSLEHITLRQTYPLENCDWSLQDHKIAMILELPETEEELMQSFKAKLRSQIRRPSKEGATARTGGPELLDDYYKVFSRNMRDLGTPVYSKQLFKSLLESEHCNSRLVVVYLDNIPVAASFLIKHGDTMEIPWASSLREYNRYSVNMLLYWRSLTYSIEHGCKYFDFGRSNKESPTYRFKKQWGSEERQLHWYQWTPGGEGNVRLDPQNSKFALATKIWQKLPLAIANLIGPHIVKNIP